MKRNKEYFQRISNLLIQYLRKRENTVPAAVEDEVWNCIRKKVEKKVNLRIYRFWVVSFSAAASLVFVLWFGYNYYQPKQQNLRTIALIFKSNIIKETEIQLIMPGQHKMEVKNGSIIKYKQDGSVQIGEKVTKKNQEQEAFNQIIVPNGKHVQLYLSDGSCLHVNAGSKVVYPNRFNGNSREIFVQGEIFIDVKKNQDIPFIVTTSTFEVKVLGTAFNVKAYENEEEGEAEVVLLRGKVEIKDTSNKLMCLLPDELASLKNGMLQEKKTVDAVAYIGWTEGLLILDNEPLWSVFNKLSRYYGEKIVFDTPEKGLFINGKLDLSEGLDKVLRMIAVTTPFVYEQKEEIYYIKIKE